MEWRWKLRNRTGRLCQVHGDFHPWNVMFRNGTDFSVLDRSRGEWGEAADDITAMAMNYIFYSVQKSFRLSGDLKDLFELFSIGIWRRHETTRCWRSSPRSSPSGPWLWPAPPGIPCSLMMSEEHSSTSWRTSWVPRASTTEM